MGTTSEDGVAGLSKEEGGAAPGGVEAPLGAGAFLGEGGVIAEERAPLEDSFAGAFLEGVEVITWGAGASLRAAVAGAFLGEEGALAGAGRLPLVDGAFLEAMVSVIF